MDRRQSLRTAIAGAIVTAGYLVASSLTLGPAVPLRPLFDGVHPQAPFRWVTPPTPDPTALPPLEGQGDVPFVERTIDGEKQMLFQGGLITTGDGQASMSIPSGVVPFKPGAKKVRFTIEQIDPVTLGAPPEGVAYDGNGMIMRGTYEPSGDPITFTPQDCSLGGCLTVIIRYAHAGTQMWIQGGQSWRELTGTTNFSSTFTMAAPVLELGTFVVTKIPGATGGGGITLSQIIAFAAGGLAVAGAVVYGTMTRRRRRMRAPAERASSPSKRSSSTKHPQPGSSKKHRGKSATRGKQRR